jgi:ElaB/YqjD/DUF883 family membrane-anchored ribosome-binding protein
MANQNGITAEEFVQEAQDRLVDIGKSVTEGANVTRKKIVEQLRETSQRIESESEKTDLDDPIQVQIKNVTQQMIHFADYLEAHSAEEIGAQATTVVKQNAWWALIAALVVGVIVGIFLSRRD